MTLYYVEHDNAITGVDYLNSELPKSSHTSPSRASYGASLWDICTITTAIHRGCTIYRCLKVPGWNYLIKEYDIYIYICIYAYVCVYTYTYMYVYVYFICICVCICMYNFFFSWVIAKYFSCVINATYLCFIAPAPFDVKYMNIIDCHLNDICSRLEIEGPIS